MESDHKKRKSLSDHALEMVMRDVLSGLRDFSLELQTETTSGSPQMNERRTNHLTPDNFMSRQRHKKG
ncbi:MAG: hypothetical protein KZQ94_13630 [Candidatus Thiodiazotropha sp. (ex Troendleina suluensis)]|nr:hypothetical protein [Candidatus Thiodiazotropha sp. (ex Troendleina suluensis)]